MGVFAKKQQTFSQTSKIPATHKLIENQASQVDDFSAFYVWADAESGLIAIIP